MCYGGLGLLLDLIIKLVLFYFSTRSHACAYFMSIHFDLEKLDKTKINNKKFKNNIYSIWQSQQAVCTLEIARIHDQQIKYTYIQIYRKK